MIWRRGVWLSEGEALDLGAFPEMMWEKRCMLLFPVRRGAKGNPTLTILGSRTLQSTPGAGAQAGTTEPNGAKAYAPSIR
jgi:hypothetical protein